MREAEAALTAFHETMRKSRPGDWSPVTSSRSPRAVSTARSKRPE